MGTRKNLSDISRINMTTRLMSNYDPIIEQTDEAYALIILFHKVIQTLSRHYVQGRQHAAVLGTLAVYQHLAKGTLTVYTSYSHQWPYIPAT